MNRHISILIAVLALLAAVMPAAAQITATQAFTTAPRKVLPLLNENTRLDMIDYFNSNMTNTSENTYGGRSRITSLSPEQITASLTDASTCQVAVLPDGKDGLIAFITTVASPAPDSRMSVYSSDWSRDVTGSVFRKPKLADWLTADGKKHQAEVEMTIPFLLISYTYDPATRTLTLTNNARQFLGDDVYQTVSSYISPSLQYKFNGSRFEPVK